MLYIDDLLFVSRYTDEHNQIHRESNDLSITFLDSRKESTKWQLQLKTEDFCCKKRWPSFDCRLSIRQRNVQRKERRSSRRIGSFSEYDHQDAGKKRVSYDHPVNRNKNVESLHIRFLGEQSTLSFPEGTSSGHYYSKHYWRFVNAEF